MGFVTDLGVGGFGEGAHPPQTVLQLSGEGADYTKGKFTLDRMRFLKGRCLKKRSPKKSVTFFFFFSRRTSGKFSFTLDIIRV